MLHELFITHCTNSTSIMNPFTCFVISFDKSFNQELQQEQIYFTVKYFKENKVACRYITSTIFEYKQAEDLKKKFEESPQDLEMMKMVQISMDGTNVNLKLYKSITEERSEI